MAQLKFLFLLLSSFILVSTVTGQSTAKLRNADFKIEDNKLILNYDLISKSNDNQSVVLFLWDNDYNIIVPKTLSGDVGKFVTPGVDRTVVWDIFEDNHLVGAKMRPELILNDKSIRRGGSSSAMYSILVPGLGGYFVANQRNMIFKPYLRTISAVGFIGLGIRATQMRERQPLYSDWVNPWTGETVTRFYGYGDYEHWLFPYDNFVFLGLGAAIWIYDIIWVASKGNKNEKLRKALNNIDLSYGNNKTSLGYRHTF